MSSLASGAHPWSTFPNNHLLPPLAAQIPTVSPPATVGAPTWASPQPGSPIEDLRRAVHEEDWERTYSEGLTRISMRAEWCASPERCSILQWLVSVNHVCRALEVGSFCGAAALAMAEAMPGDGEVHALELDSYVVDFGRRVWMRSICGKKIKHTIGPAMASLKTLADEARAGCLQPFDFAVVDADKEGMRFYFELLWKTPGLLSEEAVVCVDMTPFKGQPPLRYLKYGFPHRWESNSGQGEINALRSAVTASSDFQSHEFGGLLIVQRARAQ